MTMRSFASLCLTLFLAPLLAQSDLLDELEEMEEVKVEYATAAFKGTKIINGQSSEIAGPGVLQFVFQHRFGSLSDDFFYNFLGLDNAQVRLSIDYSFNDWLNVGVGRSSFEKTYDGFVKAKLLRQCTGAKNVPLSLTLFTSAFINTLKFTDLDPDLVNRMSYSTQLVISRTTIVCPCCNTHALHVNMVPEAQTEQYGFGHRNGRAVQTDPAAQPEPGVLLPASKELTRKEAAHQTFIIRSQ